MVHRSAFRFVLCICSLAILLLAAPAHAAADSESWVVADRTKGFINHYSTQTNRLTEASILRALLKTIAGDLGDLAGRLGKPSAPPQWRQTLSSLRQELDAFDTILAAMEAEETRRHYDWKHRLDVYRHVTRTYFTIASALQRHDFGEAQARYLRLGLEMDQMFGAIPRPQRKLALIELGQLRAGQGNWSQALTAFREYRDIAAIDAWRQGQLLASDETETARQAWGDAAQDRRAIAMLLTAAHHLAAQKPHLVDSLARETLEAAQYGLSSKAGLAVARMSARLASGDGDLAALIRERQRVSMTPDADPQMAARKRALDDKLALSFPDYAALATPQPLRLAEIQRLLGDNEALLLFFDHAQVLDGEAGGTFIWAVTRRAVLWERANLAPEGLRRAVSRLRCGLDDSSWTKLEGEDCGSLLGEQGWNLYQQSPLPPFDAQASHDLYRALIAPMAEAIAGKDIMIVPSGALTALPFHVLIAEPPPWRFARDLADHRLLTWFGMRHAMTVLPSVSSLRALRAHARPSVATRAFLGFGDPKLTGTETCGTVTVPDQCPRAESTGPMTAEFVQRSGTDRAFSQFYRDGRGRPDRLRELCPLPDTAYELRCVAADFAPPEHSLFLGAAMTETAVKAAPMDDYRVIHFATHGLLAGEAASLTTAGAEPALVMTPPDRISEDDDGLLAASEIATLELDADWVVLSACNTAGGVGPEAEALSGLARSFLFAGARALLASHWPVNSYAATMITSRTFATLRQQPALSRAEAFRQAMQAMMLETERPWAAHPAVWAPFIVVGEGGAIATVAAPQTNPNAMARRELVFRLKQRLAALRCEPGGIDASWDGLARRAVERFEAQNTSLGRLTSLEPSEDLLARLSAPAARSCATACPPWLQRADGGCDTRQCPAGQWLSIGGQCLNQDIEAERRAAEDAKKNSGRTCFEISGEQICE